MKRAEHKTRLSRQAKNVRDRGRMIKYLASGTAICGVWVAIVLANGREFALAGVAVIVAAAAFMISRRAREIVTQAQSMMKHEEHLR